jgi:hypothetical protein
MKTKKKTRQTNPDPAGGMHTKTKCSNTGQRYKMIQNNAKCMQREKNNCCILRKIDQEELGEVINLCDPLCKNCVNVNWQF